MFYRFVFAIYFLSFSGVFGQTNDETKGNKTYLNYYQEVASAEEAIVNGRYLEGVQQYQKTFAENPYNNPIDCYVAAQVASYTKDTASSNTFLLKGICFGVPIYTIINNPHLAEIFANIKKRSVDSCLSIYENSINKKARAKTISFYKKEQYLIHNLPNGDKSYESDGYTLNHKYRITWDSLLQEMMVLIKTYGFPGQKIIGTQNGEDSLRPINPHSTYAFPVFIHHGNSWRVAGTILWEELLHGNITPQMFGVIYESSNGKKEFTDSALYFASRGCFNNGCKKIVKNNLKKINEDRQNIGLCSYEVMKKKFASRHLYYKWREKTNRKPEPVFDFQCDLSFQRKM
jgi:hypothetical protein